MASGKIDLDRGKRILYLRTEVLGLESQEDFANTLDKVTRGAVGNWELGKGISVKNLKQISTRHNVSFDWLANGDGEPPVISRFNSERSTHIVKSRTKGEKVEILPFGGSPQGRALGATVPINAAAMGGEGHVIITFEPIDHLTPPEDLRNVRDAYGILVRGDSMRPAYKPGDIAWVHPHKDPKVGDDVVLYHTFPHGEAEAILKTYLGFANKQWHLRQYQPPLDFYEAHADWPICHLIVGKKNA